MTRQCLLLVDFRLRRIENESCRSALPLRVIGVAATLALSACENPAHLSAADNASISLGMDEVRAGQIRSEANVQEVEANKRQQSRDDQAEMPKRRPN